MKNLASFTYHHVILNLCDVTFVEHKKKVGGGGREIYHDLSAIMIDRCSASIPAAREPIIYSY